MSKKAGWFGVVLVLCFAPAVMAVETTLLTTDFKPLDATSTPPLAAEPLRTVVLDRAEEGPAEAAVLRRAEDRPLSSQRPPLVGISVDPTTGEVALIQADEEFAFGLVESKASVGGSFDLVGVTCTDCGTSCPPVSRTVVAVLEANTAVSAGYGVSDLFSANFAATNVTQSTNAALGPGDQVTVTVTGDVGVCSVFRVYFDVCDTAPPDPSQPCDGGGGYQITAAGEAYGHHGDCEGWNSCGDAATCALWACQINGFSTLVSYGAGLPCTQFSLCHLFYNQSSVQCFWGNWCDVAGVTDVVCSNGTPNHICSGP